VHAHMHGNYAACMPCASQPQLWAALGLHWTVLTSTKQHWQ
jgi:hypothetical protein